MTTHGGYGETQFTLGKTNLKVMYKRCPTGFTTRVEMGREDRYSETRGGGEAGWEVKKKSNEIFDKWLTRWGEGDKGGLSLCRRSRSRRAV